MDVKNFIDSAVALETELSQLYETIARTSDDLPTARKLKKLSSDELKHAAILRRGRSYYIEMPDLFLGITVDAEEVERGLEEIKQYHSSLVEKEGTLVVRIKTMLDFEKRFEKVHFGIAMKIADRDLKKLFLTLHKGDQAHVLVLKALIETLEGFN